MHKCALITADTGGVLQGLWHFCHVLGQAHVTDANSMFKIFTELLGYFVKSLQITLKPTSH